MKFLFIETAAFSRSRETLMADDELREFQCWLLENPAAGITISGTGGCQKVRWCRPWGGKSGGVRVIYYVRAAHSRIYLLIVYPKNKQDDLSQAQKAQLKLSLQRLY